MNTLSSYRYELFAAANEVEREQMLRALELAAISYFDENISLHDGVMKVIGELRAAGHDLWSFDEHDEFELWCHNWTRSQQPGISLEFRQGAVVATWK